MKQNVIMDNIKKLIHFTKNILKTEKELKNAKYSNIQLANNINRFQIACVCLFVLNGINLFTLLTPHPQYVFPEKTINILFILFSAVFYLIFSYAKKTIRSNKLNWFICYAFILFACGIQFLSIVNVTMSQQPTFPFILLINLLMILPAFKPWNTILYILLVYICTMFIQLNYLPITPFAIEKIANISAFTIICIITNIFLYSRNVTVFLDSIKLKEMNEHLSMISTIDELTGLPNRRSFNYFYDNIWSHCTRLKLPLCVIMIDIDYFKKYNDILGHVEGDKALQAVGACLKSCIKRDTDFVARYGGEEFVGIVPYVGSHDIDGFLQSVINSVRELQIPHPHHEGAHLTISLGAALVSLPSNITKAELLESADKALYEAKNTGRNRVVCYTL